MGYELMQNRAGDAGDRFHSLDDIYYYGGQQGEFAVTGKSSEYEKFSGNKLFGDYISKFCLNKFARSGTIYLLMSLW